MGVLWLAARRGLRSGQTVVTADRETGLPCRGRAGDSQRGWTGVRRIRGTGKAISRWHGLRTGVLGSSAVAMELGWTGVRRIRGTGTASDRWHARGGVTAA